MKNYKLSVAVLFMLGAGTLAYAQENKKDSTVTVRSLDGVMLRGNKKKGNENAIIAAQKKSVEIIERVGASQLEKQGVGDVAAAVTKATGTQKQEGSGQIMVRGLGDRFNTTTLNGLVIPSDDPEFKNINLELFKTSVVEYISLDKVYQPKLSGDFGGANINIVSKEHSGKPYFKIGFGSSINLQTIGKDFKVQDGAPGFFGYNITNFKKGNPNQTYPFLSSWNFKTADNPFNSNLDFEAGATFGKLSLFAYAGFDNNYVYSAGLEGFYDSTGDAIKTMNVERFNYKTNTTAIVNLAYKFNSKNRINFTSNYIHTSEQDARFLKGYMREIGTEILINRGDNKVTTAFINQLLGNHKIAETWTADWGLGYNILDSQRPDRLQNTFDASSYQLITASAINNHRYYDQMKDQTLNGFASLTKEFNRVKVNIGYNGLYKDRNFENTTIGLNFSSQAAVNPFDVDAFINPYNNAIITYNTFRPDNDRYKPFYYKFKQNIQSGYVNVDYKLSDKFVMQFGGRYDFVDIQNSWDDVIFQKARKNKTYTKFLPAFNAKYSLSEKQNLRLAASKTYTLPQPKELVPIGYYDVTTNVYGNPLLYPSDNYNLDLKWEYFPKSGEVLSVNLFAKYIQNPIARTTFSTAASSDMTYFNIANYGSIMGAEMEFRKDLASWNNSKLYTFLNATYMTSQQELKTEAEFSKENGGKVIQFSGQDKEDVQGVANFLANFNLGYNFKMKEDSHVDFVVSYGYVGKSLYAIGTNGVGNFYEKPIHLLDANLKFNLKKIGIGVTAKNLINSENKISQVNQAGEFTHRSYTRGRQLGVNLTYKF